MKESYFEESELIYPTTCNERVMVKHAAVKMHIIKKPPVKSTALICPLCNKDSLVRSLGWINSEVYYCIHDPVGLDEGRTTYYMFVE